MTLSTLQLPLDLLAQVDAHAARTGLSRPRALAQLLERGLRATADKRRGGQQRQALLSPNARRAQAQQAAQARWHPSCPVDGQRTSLTQTRAQKHPQTSADRVETGGGGRTDDSTRRQERHREDQRIASINEIGAVVK